MIQNKLAAALHSLAVRIAGKPAGEARTLVAELTPDEVARGERFKVALVELGTTPLPPSTLDSKESTMGTTATQQFPSPLAAQEAPQQPIPSASVHHSLLHFIGSLPGKLFAFLGSRKGQAIIGTGETLVEAEFPLATGVINLANTWMVEILKAEALATAAGQQDGSGVQKAAMVVSDVGPEVESFLAKHGLPALSSDKALAANKGLVDFLNAIGAPTVPAA